MEITALDLVYFSPTGSTRNILRQIAVELGIANIREYDLALPEVRKQQLTFAGNELVLLGMPVYAGRIPPLFHGFKNLKGSDTPAVYVAVYGNRAYEDALRELKDTGEASGFRSMAAAAFIAEHCLDSRIATGRPDRADLDRMRDFARQINRKLTACNDASTFAPLTVGGNFPYKPYKGVPLAPAITGECNHCGLCARECPVQIINPRTFEVTNPKACILCWRCVKNCPENARGIRGPKKYIFRHGMNKIEKICRERKDPEIFIQD